MTDQHKPLSAAELKEAEEQAETLEDIYEVRAAETIRRLIAMVEAGKKEIVTFRAYTQFLIEVTSKSPTERSRVVYEAICKQYKLGIWGLRND